MDEADLAAQAFLQAAQSQYAAQDAPSSSSSSVLGGRPSTPPRPAAAEGKDSTLTDIGFGGRGSESLVRQDNVGEMYSMGKPKFAAPRPRTRDPEAPPPPQQRPKNAHLRARAASHHAPLLGLREILCDEAYHAALLLYMEQAYCAESMHFLDAEKKYRTETKTQTERDKLGLELFTKHIGEDAPEAINVPADIATAICQSVAENDYYPLMFEDAAEEVFSMVETDVFRRFLRSDAYVEMFRNEAGGIGSSGTANGGGGVPARDSTSSSSGKKRKGKPVKRANKKTKALPKPPPPAVVFSSSMSVSAPALLNASARLSNAVPLGQGSDIVAKIQEQQRQLATRALAKKKVPPPLPPKNKAGAGPGLKKSNTFSSPLRNVPKLAPPPVPTAAVPIVPDEQPQQQQQQQPYVARSRTTAVAQTRPPRPRTPPMPHQPSAAAAPPPARPSPMTGEKDQQDASAKAWSAIKGASRSNATHAEPKKVAAPAAGMRTSRDTDPNVGEKAAARAAEDARLAALKRAEEERKLAMKKKAEERAAKKAKSEEAMKLKWKAERAKRAEEKERAEAEAAEKARVDEEKRREQRMKRRAQLEAGRIQRAKEREAKDKQEVAEQVAARQRAEALRQSILRRKQEALKQQAGTARGGAAVARGGSGNRTSGRTAGSHGAPPLKSILKKKSVAQEGHFSSFGRSSVVKGQQQQQQRPEEPPSKNPWRTAKDEDGDTYYWNVVTNEVSWEMPDDGIFEEGGDEGMSEEAANADLPPGWSAALDDEGAWYWWKGQQSTYEKPGFVSI